MKLFVLNAGSSSLKYALFELPSERVLIEGMVEAIGVHQRGVHRHASHRIWCEGREQQHRVRAHNHAEALRSVLGAVLAEGVVDRLAQIDAVGHRVVHGGPYYERAERITSLLERRVEQMARLAPLHNPHNLACIRLAQRLLPRAMQVAIFDTAFHHGLPQVARTYALPSDLAEHEHIRRYGFHGISIAYVLAEAKRRNLSPASRAIVCHIGGGVSVTAVRDGRSLDTSMGFTPLEGVLMGTRSGSVDPGVVLYLERMGRSPRAVEHLLNDLSGLYGLSGVSSDLREVRRAARRGEGRAKLALDLLAYQLAKYIGAYAMVLGGLDTLIFTAGIGEHVASLRTQVCSRLGPLGVRLDAARNRRNALTISASRAKVRVLVIPTDEELQIAREAYGVVKARRR